MQQNPAVLLMVNDVVERDRLRQRLIDLDVIPILVRANYAAAAVEEFRPIAAFLDEAHTAVAPEDFLRVTSSHAVRLLTVPDTRFQTPMRDADLRIAIARDAISTAGTSLTA